MRFISVMALLALGCLAAACAAPLPPPAPPQLAEARRALTQGHELYAQGCLTQAEAAYEAAADYARLCDDVTLIIQALNSLGTARLALGQSQAAAASLDQAMNLCLSQAKQPEKDRILANLGSLAIQMERPQDAEEFWRQAAASALEQGRSPAPYYCDLARFYRASGQIEKFQLQAAEALKAAGGAEAPGGAAPGQSQPEPGVLADALNLAGSAALQRGQRVEAEAFFLRALELDRQTENTLGLAQDTEALAALALEDGRWPQAAGFFDRAFYLWLAVGDRAACERVYDKLRFLSETQGRPRQLDGYRQALERGPLKSSCP